MKIYLCLLMKLLQSPQIKLVNIKLAIRKYNDVLFKIEQDEIKLVDVMKFYAIIYPKAGQFTDC